MPAFKSYVFLCLVFILSVCSLTKAADKKEELKIFKQDVLNFWEAYDSLHIGCDTVKIFQRLVINRASDPFKKFIEKSNITAGNYALQIRKFPKFYGSIRANSLHLINAETEIRSIIEKLKVMYPDLVMADICIGFGNFYTGGTIYVDSKTRLVYVGLEYHGLDSTAIISEFNTSMKEYLSRSNFFRTIIHELVHVQQETHGNAVKKSYYGDKLIHSVLKEGIPDFIATLIYPAGNNGKHNSYGLEHELALKEKLKNQLWQSDRSYWLYNSNTSEGQPVDLGYFMGARIANAFYEKNRSKADVIKQIIEIKNVKEFVERSGYFDN